MHWRLTGSLHTCSSSASPSHTRPLAWSDSGVSAWLEPAQHVPERRRAGGAASRPSLRRDIDVGRLGSSPQIRPARARGAADPATRAPARTAAPHTLWSEPTGPRLRQASAACWAALTAAPALSAAALTCNRTPAAVGRVLGAERGRQTAHSRRWGRCDGGFADAPVVAPSRAGNRPSPQLRRRLAPGLRPLPS